MSQAAYDRLSFQDNTFLAFETPTSHMHVSSVATFEVGSLCTPEGGVDIERIRTYVGSRLHLMPRYRQVIRYIPVENHPVWVDDETFNLQYHVRHSCLPQPGTDAELGLLCARIMSQKLDRSKPLWEMWVVEGLDEGRRFAIVNKIHHCMIDGMSGVDLMRVLLSVEPKTTCEPAPSWAPRIPPSRVALVTDAALRWASGPLSLMWNAAGIARDALDPHSALRDRLRAVGQTLQSGAHSVAKTPLNGPIGPHRRFERREMALSDVRAVRQVLGGSVNDVVLASVAGGLQRYFSRRKVDLKGDDFVVAAPVSVRGDAEQGTMGNRVSAWLIPLPLTEESPGMRLQKISRLTAELKESRQALGAEALSGVGEWTPSTLLSVAARVITQVLPINMVVTNVPGPQFPLYMLDARLIDNYGQVPLIEGLGLGIALLSYDGRICWGFNADWDVVPDVADLADDVEAAFEELLCLARGDGAEPEATQPQLA